MRGKLWFVGGLAVGFVLGARAGRERYEQLVMQGRKVLDHPTVQEAAGVAQAQANRLYAEGKDRLSHTRLGEKLGAAAGNGTTGNNGGSAALVAGDSGTESGTSSKSTTSSGSTSSPSPASASRSGGAGTNGTTF
ncbi:hypothetical protein [Plantactinospora sp. B5E13]|uniref:hypothetical protein n=1 Tax=unclassified Plantactinospora TaxID=2631981 RepID=UPI00325C7968